MTRAESRRLSQDAAIVQRRRREERIEAPEDVDAAVTVARKSVDKLIKSGRGIDSVKEAAKIAHEKAGKLKKKHPKEAKGVQKAADKLKSAAEKYAERPTWGNKRSLRQKNQDLENAKKKLGGKKGK